MSWTGTYVKISVSDTGHGIPEHPGRVFESVFHPKKTRRVRLGLSVSTAS
jgi:signal transduction histidine kinase